MDDRWVLITGCSTGIGRALVSEARKNDWCVVATARRLEALGDLPEDENLRCLELDVTDAQSIAKTVEACRDLHLVALINNAGYGQMGPLEYLRPEDLRAQLETNVVGLHAVTLAFLPLIRQRALPSEGRVIHIASVLGRLSAPLAGAYNASKHAVVALGETLRLELAPDIHVILVEPGAVRTEFRENIMKAWGDLPERVEGTSYERFVRSYMDRGRAWREKGGVSADDCARKIIRALGSKHPPRRLVIGKDAFWGLKLKTLVPAALWEWLLRRAYRIG